MAQAKKTVSQRIRTVQSSLENAEHSFSANQDIRGELDLMLAEAELKNLRRKKDVPWSWNRQLLAGFSAVLLVLAAVGGWYMARDHYKARYQKRAAAVEMQARQAAAPKAQAVAEKPAAGAAPAAVTAESNADTKTIKTINPSPEAAATQPAGASVNISKAEMHKLVHSARTELNKAQ